MSQRNIVEVILLEAWMGHPKYSTMNMYKSKAIEMVDRGVAEIHDNNKRNEDDVVNEGDIPVKKMGRPPKNKMMTDYKNK